MIALKHPRKNSSLIDTLVIPGLLIAGLGLAGKVILVDLPPATQPQGIVSFITLSGIVLKKIDDLYSDAETMVGYAAYTLDRSSVNIQINTFVRDGLINSLENFDVQFNSQEKFFKEGLKATTDNVITAGASVASAALSHLNSIKTALLSSRPKDLHSLVAKYRTSSPVMQELSQHLAHESTQQQLLALAKESCDHVMQERPEDQLEAIGLIEKDTRYQFYADVYLYLRVWLKNSIEYEVDMPSLERSIKDLSLYADAVKFLLNERADYFLTPGDQFTSPISDLLVVVRHYLGTLISRLDAEATI